MQDSQGSGCRIHRDQGAGFRGFRGQGSGFTGFRVDVSGVKAPSLGFRVQDLGIRVEG